MAGTIALAPCDPWTGAGTWAKRKAAKRSEVVAIVRDARRLHHVMRVARELLADEHGDQHSTSGSQTPGILTLVPPVQASLT